MHLQLAVKRGASQVIAVDLVEKRLSLAERLGATSVINPNDVEAVKVIHDLTGGRGVDVAIESAGAKDAWITAIQSVRKGGRVLWFGGLKAGIQIELDPTWIHYGELSLYGVFHATPSDVYSAFQLIKHQAINTDILISGELPLESTEDALNMMANGECVKMVINPDLQTN
jgi:L-iditol 2-dehydrogenase